MEFYHKNFDWPYIIREIKEHTILVDIRRENEWKTKEYPKERFNSLFVKGTWIKKNKRT